jgi:capsular polysaccharide biosynthesis protein
VTEIILSIYILKHNIGFKRSVKNVNSTQNTNLMMITAPHRHDLQETSCVNKETEVFDIKLRTMMKTADSVKIIQASVSRNDFALYG